MHARKIWLNLLITVSLLLGAIPGSALAALCRLNPCPMPCCQGKQITAKAEPAAASAPICASCAAKRDAPQWIGGSSSGLCKCSLSAGNSVPRDPAVNAPSSSTEIPAPATMPTSVVPHPVRTQSNQPRTYANDSGPPDDVRACPWIGRAPPVA